MICFEDFKKIDIRVGEILAAEKVEGSEKILKLKVDFGEEQRQILAGLGKVYEPEFLQGKKCAFVFNLEPKEIMGQESQGMILAADSGDGPVILMTEKEVKAGSRIK